MPSKTPKQARTMAAAAVSGNPAAIGVAGDIAGQIKFNLATLEGFICTANYTGSAKLYKASGFSLVF